MTLMDLYEHVTNPMDNKVRLKQYIELYLLSKNKEDFFNKVMNSFSVRRYVETNEKVVNDSKKKFAMLLFNNWKDKVINTSVKRIPIGKYELDYKFREFSLLQEYLKAANDIEFDLYDNLLDTMLDKEVDKAFKKYPFCERDVDWLYIDSYYINVEQERQMTPEHILSLNICSKVTLYKFVTYFIEQCNKRNIGYDLKFSEDLNKDNNVVIFSDNENLLKYIEILCGLEKINNELFLEKDVSINRTHFLMGSIDKFPWIGYCSNSDNYLHKRIDAIYTAIKHRLAYWYDNDFNVKETGFKVETYKEIIIDSIETNLERKLVQEQPNEVLAFCFLRKIRKEAIKLGSTKWEERYDISIKLGINKCITFTKKDLEDIVKQLLNTIHRNSPELLDDLLEEIKKEAVNNNIDSNKFCLDLDTLKSMKKYDSEKESNANTVIIPTPSKDLLPTVSLEKELYIDSTSRVWESYSEYLSDQRRKEKIKLKKLG